jgi:aspartokinase/homoserine dehydrogenase 1
VRAIAQGFFGEKHSVVISEKDVKKAVNVLHESFSNQKLSKFIFIFVGVGNVGLN